MDHPDPQALELLDATRDFADRVWRSLASPAVRAAVAAEIRKLGERLGPFEREAPVRTEIGGELPGRGHPLMPPLLRHEEDGRTIGTVTYTDAHAGVGEAVHGGQITLLFDDLLGGMASDVAKSRTAYLNVDYRSLTPMGVPLRVEGWVDRIEDRKILTRGRLLDGERLCAEAEALFVAVSDYS